MNVALEHLRSVPVISTTENIQTALDFNKEQCLLTTMQEGLVIEEPAYQALIDEFSNMEQKGITGYRVVWEAEGKEHSSTEYVIKAFGEHLGEPTAIMWGRGGNKETGGKYEIIPKPNDNAWLRYYHPHSGPDDYKLTRLAVFSPDFVYEDEEEYTSFWKNPFEKLAEIKNRR